MDARDKFLGSLSEADKKRYSSCSSVEDLLDGLKKLDIIVKQKRQGTKSLETVKRFYDRLQPYFDVANIFVQVDPQHAGLA